MSASINRGILLKTRTSPTETVDTGEAYFWLEGTSLKYKDDTQTIYTLSTGVTPEEVEDIVGNFITAGSSKVSVVYNDGADTLTIDVVPANIDHNSLLNYTTNRHIDHSTVSISAGSGLSGGGDITTNRTISMPNVGTAGTYGSTSAIPVITTDAQGRVSGVTTASISSASITDFTEAAQDAVGGALVDSASVDFTYNDAGSTITATVLPGGVNHNALLNYLANEHVNHSSVSITAGTSLNGGGNITTTRTINHNTFGTAGTYGSASSVPVITTESTGHVSSVTNTAISILSSAVSDFASGVRAVVLTGLSIVNSAVTAADSVLTAIGKLQGQINQIIADMSVWTELVTTADIIVNSNTTLTNVTELGVSVVAGRSYYLEYTIMFRTAATTTGFTLSVGTTDTAAGTVSLQVNLPIAADGTAALYTGSITSFVDVVTSTSVQTAQPTWFIANMKGVFLICTTSGTLVPQFRSEVNGSNVNFGTGSVVLCREFA